MEANFQNDEVQSEKYLVFKLDEKNYGIPILKVDGINCLMKITPMPQAPSSVKGVINLRGQIIPVIDMRIKFNIPECGYNEQTCIIVVNVCIGNINKLFGLIVDTVSEVFDIPLSEIEDPPRYGSTDERDCLLGIGKTKGTLVMILDIEEVIGAEGIISLNGLDENSNEVEV